MDLSVMPVALPRDWSYIRVSWSVRHRMRELMAMPERGRYHAVFYNCEH